MVACRLLVLLGWFALPPAGAQPGIQGGELPAPVAQALRTAGIPVAATAVLAREVDAARPGVAVNVQTAMNPASTIKLLTTFAALELLGPAYVWQTEAHAGGKLKEGVLYGDLYLRGNGDPRLTYDQFQLLLRQVRARGIREIRGDLVLDRSAFSLPDTDSGRFDGQPLRPYNVPPDALLLNFRSVRLALHPDGDAKALTVSMEPAPTNLDLVSRVRLHARPSGCGDWKEALRADLSPRKTTTVLLLTGAYPAGCGDQIWNLSVLDHPQFMLGVFRQLWIEIGGRFDGKIREGTVPADATLVTSFSSPPLAEIVRDINKFSNNVMARQLFLTLGLESGHRPARPEDGAAAVRGWLEARGLAMPELVLENGSGLSRQERISASNLGSLLQTVWKSAVMPELMSSLPVSATDGTMKKRLKSNGVAGQAHIKTGSLEGVKSMAGYVLDRTGRRWIVVFMVNHPAASQAQGAMDALLQWVWEAPMSSSSPNSSAR